MLNIIGGLDQYTRGDLIINGRSTRDFRDRDWDTYRNHSIGFVFQSYNLIPHQTVLQNVELALTLSGVPRRIGKSGRSRHWRMWDWATSSTKAQRDVRRTDAACRHCPCTGQQSGHHSGGRATGALDTKTSVQIMDILKEVSRNRLVIMVTHNPELAEQYSSRIIRMLDGVITDDTAPLSDEEIQAEQAQDAAAQSGGKKKQRRPSMSFFTAFSLSLKNLITKKGRTALTGFAGSIGIIGIATILALSNGVNNYIGQVEEETLSSYPLTITKSSFDLSALLGTADTNGPAGTGSSGDSSADGASGTRRLIAHRAMRLL